MKSDNTHQVATFWNNIASEFDAIYTGNKSTVGRMLDHWLRKDIYQRFDWVMDHSGDLDGQRVCDIGCGSGRFVVEFAKRGASHVTGVDVAPEMLKLARRLAAHEGVDPVCNFVHADVLNWKTTETYDLTIAIGFWDYIMQPEARLGIIRSLTKGKFLSAWPRFWTWRMPVRKVRLQYMQGCPVYFYRRPQVYRLLEWAGFEVVSCETVGKLFCVDARPI
jgi:SAM-dependent methyltransferase